MAKKFRRLVTGHDSEGKSVVLFDGEPPKWERQPRMQAMNGPLFHMIAGGPRPVAPFSHAVETDGWVFVTGQMPNDSDDHAKPLPEGIEAQTHQVMRNLQKVLDGIGLDLGHVLFARVYLTHFEEDYAAMNAVYASYFPPGRRPARTCIGVTGLALKARIEIDLVAKRGEG
jgi:2-iminobutanoate/2-iminopropanoate deaminase